MRPGRSKVSRTPSGPSARRIAKNTFFLGLSEIVARFSTWALVAFLGRSWSVGLYGQYAVAVNWVSIFAVVSELGLNALTVREVAHRRQKASFFLRHVLVLRSSFSLLFWGLLLFIGWRLHYEPVLVTAMAVMGMRLILDSMEGGYIYLFQAHQEMGPYALVNILCAGIRLLGIILVVSAGAQIVGAGSLWTLASAFGFLAMMVLGHRRGWKPRFSDYRQEDSWRVLWMALPLATFGTFQTLYYRIDSVILKSLSGNEAVAFYDMAARVLFVVFSVSQLYSQAIYPAFASLRDRSRARDFGRLAFQGGKVLFLLGLPMTVGGTFLAEPLLVLVGGPQYAPSGPAFAVLALSILPFFLSMIYTDILAVKNARSLNLQFFFLFALNVALNFLFIPRWNFIGAAWATVLCEYLGLVTGFVLAKPYLAQMGKIAWVKPLLASVVSGALMGLGMWAWPGFQWLILGPLVYGLGVLVLGALDKDEWKGLKGILGRQG